MDMAMDMCRELSRTANWYMIAVRSHVWSVEKHTVGAESLLISLCTPRGVWVLGKFQTPGAVQSNIDNSYMNSEFRGKRCFRLAVLDGLKDVFIMK